MEITKQQADLAYEVGKPLISDEEYDKRFGVDSSGKILPENTPWKKFQHKVPVASLNKIAIIDENNKPFFTEFEEWATKYKSFVITPKYDGAAIILYYKNGILTNAVTRGDGKYGEDVTRNILKAQNVLRELPDKNIIALVGEAILLKDTFKTHLANQYENSRNGGTGILKDFSGKNAHHLTVKYHGVHTTEDLNEFEKMLKLQEFEIHDTHFAHVFQGDVITAYKTSLYCRDILSVETDGIVVTINDKDIQKQLGRNSSGNPNYSVALKFPYPRKTTKIINIHYQMGIGGRITPVAEVQEIDFGVKVTKASLHNMDVLKNMQVSIGDEVEVSRRGDVIPYVEKNLTKHENWELKVPSSCPVCSSEVIIDGAYLQCTNEECEARKLGDLYKWSEKIKDHFKVKGLGPERIYQAYKAGLVKDVVDLYTISVTDWEILPNVKEKAAVNISEYQEYRIIPLDVVLGGLNFPGIGQGIFKFIIESGYNTFDKIFNLSKEDLTKIKNLGETRASLIHIWLRKKKPLIDRLLQHINIAEPEKVTIGSLTGKSFCITGTLSRPRTFFEDLIKQNGGTIKSVSSKLDYLVVGEDAGSKLEKAKNGFTTILTEQQFKNMVA